MMNPIILSVVLLLHFYRMLTLVLPTNKGIYVAVVLVVYLILVIILLCRYAKRRRPTTLTDLGALDATTEQGRFPFLNIHRLTSCEGDGCFHSLTNSCYGKRSSAADATSSKSTSQNPDECGGGGNQELNSMTKCGKKEDDHIGKTNGNIEELNRNKNGENQQPLLHPLKEQPTGSTSVIEASSHPHDDSEENEDDSLEDD